MSAVQSNTFLSQPSVPDLPESSSTSKSSRQPQPSAQAEPTKLADLRQLTLENGRIIDLPVSILQGSPPKPAEFLHLQHHFEATRGTPIDISACKTADEAIDVLADEIEAIRMLLYGYVVNFKRYVDRFEAAHTEVRNEALSVAESYRGLAKLAGPAQESARLIEDKFFELKKRIADLPVGRGPIQPPPLKRLRGGLNNPALSPEENKTIKTRQGERFEENSKISGVRESEQKLVDAALVKDILEPSAPPKPKAKKQRKKLPFDHELTFRVDKVVDGIETARAQLEVAQDVTSRNLAVLRYLEDESQKDGRELWAWYDVVERVVATAGKISQANERRVEAYHKWATQCVENAAPTTPEVPQDAPTATPATDTPDASPPAPFAATNNGDSQVPPPAVLPDDAMVVDGEVYAITLDLKCEKPYDELTHEEAISVLKSLPVRVNFVPYVPPAPSAQDEAAAETGAKSAAASETPCPSPANKTPSARSAALSDASPPESERCAPKPRSRKRGRQDADGESDTNESAGADKADPRPDAGGSPIKKKRGGNA
ncbi:hypothetical protein C2E23DRAFT_890312 [Lenzites betulinus]|nr:hypothetical protein C2E23DRAFT_890312 [Lenzites betulinus]